MRGIVANGALRLYEGSDDSSCTMIPLTAISGVSCRSQSVWALHGLHVFGAVAFVAGAIFLLIHGFNIKTLGVAILGAIWAFVAMAAPPYRWIVSVGTSSGTRATLGPFATKAQADLVAEGISAAIIRAVHP